MTLNIVMWEVLEEEEDESNCGSCVKLAFLFLYTSSSHYFLSNVNNE